jgi:hypothetical protein
VTLLARVSAHAKFHRLRVTISFYIEKLVKISFSNSLRHTVYLAFDVKGATESWRHLVGAVDMQLLLKFLVPDFQYFSTACRHTCRSCTNAALGRSVLDSLERLSSEAKTRLTGTTLHLMYPSFELLRHLGVRFSSMYMDQKWHSCEILMQQHYNLFKPHCRCRRKSVFHCSWHCCKVCIFWPPGQKALN